MQKIEFSHVDAHPPQRFALPRGLTFAGAIESRPVIATPGRPLHCWSHALAQGASVHCAVPSREQCFFVYQGAVRAGSQDVPRDGAVLVEHGGRIDIAATGEGAQLIHFFRPDAYSAAPRRAGGHVHVVGPEGIYASAGKPPMVMFADSTCPTCEIWLHRTPQPPNRRGGLHTHDADEIMFIVEGEALFGRKLYGVGAAVAINANVPYMLNAGPNGLTALNFRLTFPRHISVPRDGSPPEIITDYDVIQERIRCEAAEVAGG